MPGLDGLRAIAVMAVLLYHGGWSLTPGGYLGVEVFFVISGFLITSLLLIEQERTGAVGLRSFWVRRARRLLPALFTVLLAVAAYVTFFDVSQAARLREEAVGAFLYVSNWQLIFSEQSYFDAWNPSYLQHLWSLAIEEQFYLIWPVLVVGGLFLLGRKMFVGFSVVLGVTSALLVFVLFVPGDDPSRIYYGTDTRLAGLLMGALLAFAFTSGRLRRLPTGVVSAVGVAGVLGIVASFAFMTDYGSFLYQGGLVLVGLSTVGVLIGVAGRATAMAPLRWVPLVWIGTRSYSIYLWHWPVMIATGGVVAVRRFGIPLLFAQILLTVLLAEATFRLIEDPIRRGGWPLRLRLPVKSRLVPTLTLISIAGALTLGLLAVGQGASSATAPENNLPEAIASTSTTTTLIAADLTLLEPEVQTYALNESARTEVSAETAPAATTTTILQSTTTSNGPQPPTSSTVAGSSTTAMPTTTATTVGEPGGNRPVLMIGDSVMVGTKSNLQAAFGGLATVNTQVSRQWDDGIALLAGLKSQGHIWEVVFIHLGTNAAIAPWQFDAMMAQLKDVPQVVFMTVHVPRQWETQVNEVIRSGVTRYGNAGLMDWQQMAYGNPSYVGSDGVHATSSGRAAYAGTARAIARVG